MPRRAALAAVQSSKAYIIITWLPPAPSFAASDTLGACSLAPLAATPWPPTPHPPTPQVLDVRKKELGQLGRAIPYRVAMQTLLFAAPTLAMVICFAIYGGWEGGRTGGRVARGGKSLLRASLSFKARPSARSGA